ncbi:19802_t:CDS:1, partial [Gigaspora margarita]
KAKYLQGLLCPNQEAKTLDNLICCTALEDIWLKLEAQTKSLGWASFKNKTRAVITLWNLVQLSLIICNRTRLGQDRTN